MDDYRNSPTIKLCADLFPAHRCPSVLKPLDDPTRLLLRCSRWSLGHRSSDVKSSTARISSHLSNRALLCLQPVSAVVCPRHTLQFANSKQRMNKISPKPCHKKCRSANLRVCKSASLQVCRSAGLQVCSLRLSHTDHSVWRKKVFWTWLQEMFIFSNVRGDISLLDVYRGAAIIQVCLWSRQINWT